jgi:hypothetical protein
MLQRMLVVMTDLKARRAMLTIVLSHQVSHHPIRVIPHSLQRLAVDIVRLALLSLVYLQIVFTVSISD